MKIIAFYLPQFHAILENDEWWGKGFTEWVNVKKAEPLYEGHYQPRVPLNNNYYNLLDKDIMKWQVDLAKEHGLYGFCFYHYWFDGKLLLEKPVENYLKNKELDLPFCLCWANENWTNTWAASNTKILIEQKDGNKEKWKEHFDYLLPFFLDERYIKIDDRPLLLIYKPDMFANTDEMLNCLNEFAIDAGLNGLTFVTQLMPDNIKASKFDYHIEYQPTNIYIDMTKTKNKFMKTVKNCIKTVFKKIFRFDLEGVKSKKLRKYDYDVMWQKILDKKVESNKMIPGAFVDWDNTARKQHRGYVIDGATPAKFEYYLKKQIINARDNYKKDMIFLFAWNEWAECGYLEPDEKFGYEYLKALKNALADCNEL